MAGSYGPTNRGQFDPGVLQVLLCPDNAVCVRFHRHSPAASAVGVAAAVWAAATVWVAAAV